MNKNTAKQVQAAIRKVLWEQWDPIGVNDEPAAYGEYDSYADSIYSLLLRGVSDKEIAQYLWQIETVNMGLPPVSKEHLTAVVNALRAVDLEPPGAP